MDFLGLLWVASLLNIDFTALSASVLPSAQLIGQLVVSNDPAKPDDFTAAPGSAAFQTGTFQADTFQAGTFQTTDQTTEHQSWLASAQALLPGPAELLSLTAFGQTLLLSLPLQIPLSRLEKLEAGEWPGTLGFANQVSTSSERLAIARKQAKAANPISLLPPSSIDGDPRYLALVPQLPVLPGVNPNWAIWQSVANVSVVQVNSKTEDTSRIDFLQSDKSCLAFSSAFETGQTEPQTEGSTYQIWIHDTPIGEVKTAESAYQIAAKLRRLMQLSSLQPARLKPLLGDSFAAGGHGNEILFVVDQAMLVNQSANPALLASQWINNLRVAFGEAPMALADVQMIAYGLQETRRRINGTASWYGPYFHGRQTATGEIFNQYELTAAHPSLPFGTYLKVRNLHNDKTIVVRINDRGPYVGDRSLDLSYAAAQCLGSETVGVISYEATILKPGIPTRWDSALVAGLNR
jgi:Lytic transglycolase